MKEIEEKIKNFVSKETIKAAKELYRSGAVVFSFSDNHEKTILIIKDKSKLLHEIKISDIDSFIISHKKRGLNPAETAALIHFNKFKSNTEKQQNDNILINSKTSKKPVSQTEENFSAPKAKLLINSIKSLPHSSSTWESCALSVELLYKGRYYKGNSNKLRQLRFDDSKTGVLKLSDFSFQDRQIIRFLSQHGEPDDAGFSLRSDIMAEFFHSLHGFQGFYCGKEQIIIHRKIADIVCLYSNKPSGITLTPALMIENKTLPLIKGYSFIMGKSGVWLGVLGEYWWIPAVCDTVWLRKMLLADTIFINSADQLKNYPVRVIQTQETQFKERKCSAEYYIDFTENNQLSLSLKFNYNGTMLPVANSRLAEKHGSFWKRDKQFERTAENDLLRLGFKDDDENNNSGNYIIEDLEGIGFFFAKIYPLWVKSTKNIYLLPRAVYICSPAVPLKFICSDPSETLGSYRFNYEIYSGSGTISWKLLLKNVKENRRFVLLNNNSLGMIPEELSTFVSVFAGLVKTTKDSGIIQVPKGSILYWIKAGKPFFEKIPHEWEILDNIEDDGSELKYKTSVDSDFSHHTLRKYQEDGVSWMKKMIGNGFNVILADEMGLGKTIQALAFIKLYKQKISKTLPCMVVCPTSLVENWKAECEKFTPNLKFLMIAGSNREDALQRVKEFDLIITSYALIKKDIERYSKFKFGLLILDEAQHIKNPATINAKVCKSVVSKHRLVLTGTPLENSPEDIWSIFDFLNPGMLGSRESFKSNYSKIEYNYEKQKELADRIAPFILRRHKKDVEQLPEKIEQTLYCEMQQPQRKLYDKILSDGKIRYQSFFDGKTTRFDILTSLLRLRQLCCHPGLLPDTLRQGVSDSAKTELLKELLLEAIDSGHRTLVFSQFTSLLAILKDWLDEKNIIYEYLDGSTKNRFEKVNNFNANSEINLFLLSLKAGGTGLNLTGADTVIIYDPWWNPSVEAQATDRTHRIGQKKKITSIKLVVRDSIEEKILELQSKKQGLFNGIIENSSSFKKLSDKDLAYLLN